MKKRVLALLLCILMVLPLMLTSCGGGEDPDDTTTEEDLYVKPATLNFYIIGEKFDADSVALMQDAFNKRAKELYKTQVEFIFCTAEEYEAKLMGDLDTVAEITGHSAAKKYEESEVVTSIDEFNSVVEHYPEIYNNQIDIMLINGKDLYTKLRGKGYLADVTELLNTQFRDIAQRVNGNLIKGAMDGGSMYAVPNNTLIGTYKYVAVHKEIAYLLNYDVTESDFTVANKDNTKQLLDYSKLLTLARNIQASKDGTDPELADIYAEIVAKVGTNSIFPMAGAFDFPTVSFFPKGSEPENQNTLFGVVYDFDSTYTNVINLENVLNNVSYKNHLSLMIEAKREGYYPDGTTTVPDNTVYGIQYFEGSYTDRFAYEGMNGEGDYFVFEIDRPRLEDDGAFEAMFAVSKYSASPERAMEIISALVADEEAELRNILLYGKEGTHYDYNAALDIVIPKSSAQYKMNVNYTGNVITAYACPEYGRDHSYAGYFKMQNDSATRNPLFGMTSARLWNDTLTNMANETLAKQMPDKIKEEINAITKTTHPTILEKANTAAEISAKKTELINGIPKNPDGEISNSEMIGLLRSYWVQIRADIDPTIERDEDDEPITIPFDVNKAMTDTLLAMEEVAKTNANAFIEAAAERSVDLMNRALACTDVEDLEDVCNESTATDNDGTYFYNDSSNSYYGMLMAGHDSTLAGALQAWWKTIS